MSSIYNKHLKIVDFNYPIRSILELPDRYVIVLEIPSEIHYPNNVFCYNKDGKLLWQVESQELLHPITSYYGLEYKDNHLIIFSSSIEREIDINTGKIINADFFK
ncbi:MAG: hypothetical protein KG003_10725 [Bacteroidetes bacterium]|nr:hypothetical protein [Bacteroidota bacterium]